MKGWYRQQRNLSERPWYKDSLMVHLYQFLKERAYVSDGRYEGKLIRKGSCPVTRSEMAEMTGMSLKTIDRTLRRLISFGEIIVKGNNRFSVISVCDYDGFEKQETLFGTADDISNDTTDDTAADTAADTTLIYTKEGRIKEDNNLISFSYKTEREKEDLLLEIKNRYNKRFTGKLPPCIRLTMPTKVMMAECIRRFGMQAIDIVFEQLEAEPFSMGQNKTGFIARFQFIFDPKNFQGYLERAKLRKQRGQMPETVSQPQQAKKSVGVIESEPQQTQKQDRRAFLLSWVDAEKARPSERGQELLQSCYQSGELQRLGIDWKPNNNKTI